MGLSFSKTGAMERMGYGDEAKYHQIDSLGGALEALRTKGSRMKTRIIAGSIVCVLMVFVFLAVSYCFWHCSSKSRRLTLLYSSLPIPPPQESDNNNSTNGGSRPIQPTRQSNPASGTADLETKRKKQKPHQKSATTYPKSSKSPSSRPYAHTMKSTLLWSTRSPRNLMLT
jgi:hypothetical protein